MTIIGEYLESGHIRRSSDGAFVPPDPLNPAYAKMIERTQSGDEIAPYMAPPAGLANMAPDQFWFVVRVSGYGPALMAWLASMNDTESSAYDPVAWAGASAKLQFSIWFERSHPFIEAARAAMGMSVEELDALWAYGMA